MGLPREFPEVVDVFIEAAAAGLEERQEREAKQRREQLLAKARAG